MDGKRQALEISGTRPGNETTDWVNPNHSVFYTKKLQERVNAL